MTSMAEKPFTNLEIRLMFEAIRQTQDLHSKQNTEIINRQDYTNGKLKKVILAMTVLSSVTVTLLFTNGSELLDFVLKII